jgi:hypothetical protein
MTSSRIKISTFYVTSASSEDPFAFPPSDTDGEMETPTFPIDPRLSLHHSSVPEDLGDPFDFPPDSYGEMETRTLPIDHRLSLHHSSVPEDIGNPFDFPPDSDGDSPALPATAPFPSSSPICPTIHDTSPPPHSGSPSSSTTPAIFEEIPFRLVPSRNGTTLVEVDGIRFHKKRRNKETTSYRCSRYKQKCSATLLMDESLTTVIYLKGFHNH